MTQGLAEKKLTAAASNSNGNIRTNRKPTTSRRQKWEDKQLYGYFKRQTGEIKHDKSWTWLRKENLERKTKFLLIAAQNNAIRTKYMKAKIDYMQ